MLRWCRLCSSGAGVTGLRLVRRQILHAETPQSLRQDALALGKVRGAGDSSTLAEMIISKAPYYTHFQIFIFSFRPSVIILLYRSQLTYLVEQR